MLKPKKTAGSTLTVFWSGACLGCPWKCTEASAAAMEAPGDRSERGNRGRVVQALCSHCPSF